MITRKSAREIKIMQEAGRIVGDTLDLVESMIAPGVTTASLDREAEKFIRSQGASPSFKGYRGFPAATCISVNEEVVHGLPGNRKLQEGDIASVDIGAFYQGYHGDAAKTFPVGKVTKEIENLLKVCSRCLELAIQVAKPGNKLSEICKNIQNYAESAGYNVVRDYTGHGIGKDIHEDPQIPNYVDPKWLSFDLLLKPGYCLAIEPMVNLGTFEVKSVRRKGWDVVITSDHKWSAHFEHTIAILEEGPLILTLSQKAQKNIAQKNM